jgi:hypothetical protein
VRLELGRGADAVPSDTVFEVVELPDDGMIGGGDEGAAEDGADEGTADSEVAGGRDKA